MSAARKLGKRAAPVEKRYFVANKRSPASPRIGPGRVLVGALANCREGRTEGVDNRQLIWRPRNPRNPNGVPVIRRADRGR